MPSTTVVGMADGFDGWADGPELGEPDGQEVGRDDGHTVGCDDGLVGEALGWLDGSDFG